MEKPIIKIKKVANFIVYKGRNCSGGKKRKEKVLAKIR